MKKKIMSFTESLITLSIDHKNLSHLNEDRNRLIDKPIKTCFDEKEILRIGDLILAFNKRADDLQHQLEDLMPSINKYNEAHSLLERLYPVPEDLCQPKGYKFS